MKHLENIEYDFNFKVNQHTKVANIKNLEIHTLKIMIFWIKKKLNIKYYWIINVIH